ncbi:MAG: FtsH protease activity modulator HflK [Gammaproteobacteria bacterium]|nr:FtsH protease activity modulator HflK [Gammaproteobacteria bacterium]
MAWNEPGGNKDPWGRKPQTKNELDNLLKDFNKFFKKVLGGGSSGDGTGPTKRNTSILVASILVIYFLSGIYIVNDGERGVVLQFGEFHSITTPGPHWVPRIVRSYEIVDVSKIRSVQQKAVMLTEDENIVSVNFAVQYDVKDASNFIFNLRDPDETLSAAAESAIREVLGKNKMDFVITEGRESIAQSTQILLQTVLDSYQSGINVQTVNILEAQPPEQVQDAFSDAIRAREDEQRYINEAEAYRNEIIPLARGKAKQIIEEAKAYQVKLIKSAEGEALRFTKLFEEYQKAPEVTRERLYLESVESVLGSSTKVMIDLDGGNNLLYLPLDKILEPRLSEKSTNQSAKTDDSTNTLADKIRQSRDSFNSRKRSLYNE